jgi:WD40 repeat protein
MGRCLRAGGTWHAEDFLAACPDVGADADSALELIYTEFVLREELGQQPSPEEWYRRFPRWREDLRELFEVDRLVHVQAKPSTLPPTATLTEAATVGGDASGSSHGLGSYELLEEIGRGGMGVVYRARQLHLDRIVALKMTLLGDCAGAEEVRRFRDEAAALASLQDANIVQIYEVGEDDGRPYFSLEYVDGGNLEQKLKEGLVTVAKAVAILETVARAVHRAHEHGIIHRDLKPSNILLTREGVPKITDFGLSKRQTAAAAERTRSGALLGTPAYMAPEQAEGKTGAIGRPADIYALGAILYEMLSGRPPFQGENPLQVLAQVRSEEPIPPGRLRPQLPRDVETICLKCLAKEPARRYADALALAEDLRRYVEGRPISARPAGRAERLWRWCRRNPALASTAALAATLMLAVAVVSTAFAIYQSTALEELARTNEDLKHTDEQRLRFMRMSTLQTVDQALSLAEEGYANRGLVLLAHSLRLVPPADEELLRAIRRNLGAWRAEVHSLTAIFPRVLDLRERPNQDGWMVLTENGEDTAQLWDVATGLAHGQALRHEARVRFAAFSDDGKFVLTGSDDKTARLWEVAGGRPAGPALRHAKAVERVQLSHDGLTALTFIGPRTAQLWAARTGQPLGAPLHHEGNIHTAFFSPDSRIVLTAGEDNAACLWAADTGQPLPPPLVHKDYVVFASFSHNGQMIVTASKDKSARVWNAATKQPLGPALLHNDWLSIAIFHPDGKTVFAGGNDRLVQQWDVATGQRVGPPMRHRDDVLSLQISDDGRVIVTGGRDHTAQLWDLATRKPFGSPLQHPGLVGWAGMSHDGHSVITTGMGHAVPDVTSRFWAISPAVSSKIVVEQLGTLACLGLSPDGRCLVTASENGTVGLWGANSGKPLGPLLRHPDKVWAAAVAGDGCVLVTGCVNGIAQLWNSQNGEPLGPPLRHGAEIDGVAISPDGKTVLTGCYDGKAQLWEAVTGRPAGPPLPHPDKIHGVAFSPDAKLIGTACQDGKARLWDPATGQLLTALPSGTPLWSGVGVPELACLAFSPDSRMLVTGGYDYRARLWDVNTGKPLAIPLPHEDTVYGVAFSADGKTVATASADKTARLWDVVTGKPLGPAMRHAGRLHGVAFEADGKSILTACEDGTVQRWAVPTVVLGDVDRVILWSEVISGLELDANGGLRALDTDAWRERKRQLAALGGPPD